MQWPRGIVLGRGLGGTSELFGTKLAHRHCRDKGKKMSGLSQAMLDGYDPVQAIRGSKCRFFHICFSYPGNLRYQKPLKHAEIKIADIS